MKKLLFIVLIILPLILFSQMTKRDSLWLVLKPFVGEWKGEGGAEPGKGNMKEVISLF